jgi:hypothetical protein
MWNCALCENIQSAANEQRSEQHKALARIQLVHYGVNAPILI